MPPTTEDRVVDELGSRTKTAKSMERTVRLALEWLEIVNEELAELEELTKAKTRELWRARDAHLLALSEQKRYEYLESSDAE